jgi:tetratricopeptide (TPR) repeat protein
MFERASAICIKDLGLDHLYTIFNLHDIGCLYGARGEFGKAQDALERADRLLDPEHPNTLILRHSSAFCPEQGGHIDRASVVNSQVLKGREIALGKDHLNTLETAKALRLVRAKIPGNSNVRPVFQQQ